MKKLFLAVIALLATAFVYAQKIVLLSSTSRVPQGKKWIIPLKRSVILEVVPQAFQLGNLCSAELLSNNPSVAGLGVGSNPYAPADIYSIYFTGAKSIGASVPTVLTVIPRYFGHNRGGYGITTLNENLVIEEGQYVLFMGCLAGIQVFEYAISPAEIAARKATAAAAAKAEAAAAKAEAKRRQEAEAQRKREEDAYLKERLDGGKPFEADELDRPVRIVLKEDADTVTAGREFARLLAAGKQEYYTCRVEVDATGNIVGVESGQLNAEVLRPLVMKYFKPAGRGELTFQRKQYNVPCYQYITLQLDNQRKEVSSYVLAGKKGVVFISPKTEQKDTTSPHVPFLKDYVNSLPEKEQKSLHRRLLRTDYVKQYIIICNGKESDPSTVFFGQMVPRIGAVEVDKNARLKNEVANKIVSGALILGSFL